MTPETEGQLKKKMVAFVSLAMKTDWNVNEINRI